MKHESAAPPVCDQAIPRAVPAQVDLASAALTSAEFDLFAELGRKRRVDAGQVLFRRGELGTTMYVIAQGSIDLDFGDDLVGKRLGPCEFFGELGLLVGDHARSADAIAATDCVLVELRHEEFQRLVDRDPARVSFFLRRAIMRVVGNEQSLIRRLRRRNHDLQTALDNLRATTHRLNRTEELIRTDELTGLYNRRGLALYLQESRSVGAVPGAGLLLIDCDRFKQVNDLHGHAAGDRVLQSIANILRSVAGPYDLACRLGGDEFCLLISADHRDDIGRYADFIIGSVQALGQVPQSPPVICPVSIGACALDPDSDWDHWYVRADDALYRAKRAGGNRVLWHEAAVATL